MLAFGLTIALGAVATTVLPAALPHSAQATVSAYQNCLFDAIDEQDRRAVYSERHVLSACAGVRHAKYAQAMARLNDAGWPADSSRRRIHQRFAELDESVWTIVGHVRVRHARK
jgi:hypothetical protein